MLLFVAAVAKNISGLQCVISDTSRSSRVYRKVFGAIATRLDAEVGPPCFHTEMKLFLNH